MYCYKTNNVNIDFLQQYENVTKVYVKYATLSEYFDALWANDEIEYGTLKNQDFFPYFYQGYWVVRMPYNPLYELLIITFISRVTTPPDRH